MVAALVGALLLRRIPSLLEPPLDRADPIA